MSWFVLLLAFGAAAAVFFGLMHFTERATPEQRRRILAERKKWSR